MLQQAERVVAAQVRNKSSLGRYLDFADDADSRPDFSNALSDYARSPPPRPLVRNPYHSTKGQEPLPQYSQGKVQGSS